MVSLPSLNSMIGNNLPQNGPNYPPYQQPIKVLYSQKNKYPTKPGYLPQRPNFPTKLSSSSSKKSTTRLSSIFTQGNYLPP